MKSSLVYALLMCILYGSCTDRIPEDAIFENRQPAISPDYQGLTIPFNIAPLHFTIQEEADKYLTALYSTTGKKLVSGGKKVTWNLKEWQHLLASNKGDTLYMEIFLKKGDTWKRYAVLKNRIAHEDIDPYISYRLILPSYVSYEGMTINQRNLTTFEEKVIYDNMLLSKGEDGQCINCHSYQSYHKTGNMQFHIRQRLGGTMIITKDTIRKVNLKTAYTISGGVYPAWHPTENVIAYSVNDTRQSFHTKDIQKIEVMDTESSLILYDIEKNEIRDIVNDPSHLETFPSWSADGKYLYYVSAAYPEELSRETENAGRYNEFYYNIYRKSFDAATRTFGYTDTIFEASEYKKSATLPRESPDGKYLLFTLGDFGNFHIWHKSSDLYLLDMHEWSLRPMTEINSPDVESYHSWSSNGRWIIFSSRRDDGSYTRPYIAYFDKEGKEHKPFILPQKDPDFYMEFFKSYNIPEFMAEPVTVSRKDLVEAIKKEAGSVIYRNVENRKEIVPDGKTENFYE